MTAQLDHRVRIEQIRLIYRQGPVLVLGATLAGIVVAAFLWSIVSTDLLQLWLALVFFSAFLRVVVFLSYNRAARGAKSGVSVSCLSAESTERAAIPEPRFWGLCFCGGSFLAGAVWGVLPVLAAPEISPVYLLLLSTVFAGMVAVKASAGSVYLPSFYAFAVPMVLPLCVVQVQTRTDYLLLTAVLLLLYLFISALLAHRGSRQYLALIRARERNAQLMAQVSEEKQIAERAVRAKDRFLAATSHDLRQPLHALGMFVGSLRQYHGEAERSRLIDDIEVSTQSLSQLLHSLLDISKLDAGVLRAHPEAVSLKSVLMPLVQEFTTQIHGNGLEFSVQIDDVWVHTDPILLDRIIRNLLSNALRYTEHGEISLSARRRQPVTTEPDSHADKVTLELKDTGIGIDKNDQQIIFEEYRQLAPACSGDSGLGLGLSIVDRLCRLLNAPLELESTLQAGSTFRLLLPLAEPVTKTQSSLPVACTLRNTMVLLVDDEQQVRESVGRRLRENGCDVLTAASAREAVYQCAMATRTPDIVLCDYRLRHGESGIDVVTAVREGSGKPLPSLLITGDTSSDCLRDAADHAMTVLHKPLDEKQLFQAMQGCLSPPQGSQSALS